MNLKGVIDSDPTRRLPYRHSEIFRIKVYYVCVREGDDLARIQELYPPWSYSSPNPPFQR